MYQEPLKGEVQSKTKMWYVVETVAKPHDLNYFCSYLRTFPDIPHCFSSKSILQESAGTFNITCIYPKIIPSLVKPDKDEASKNMSTYFEIQICLRLDGTK